MIINILFNNNGMLVNDRRDVGSCCDDDPVHSMQPLFANITIGCCC